MSAAVAYPNLQALRLAHTELLRRHREHGADSATLAAAQEFLRRGHATGAILDDGDERFTAQGLLDYWVASLYRAGDEPPPVTLDEFDPAQAPALPDAARPYNGLDAFREEDAGRFFGRRRLVEQLVAQLAHERLLVILGPSGSGKSSLVRAGIVPALRGGALPGSEGWRYPPPIVPGSHPLAALAQALPGVGEAGAAPTLLVVDQFEEIYTLCADEEERAAAIAAIVRLVSEPGSAHRAVLTMRSDFEPFVARSADLLPLFEAAKVYMPPLSAAELREAITRPAELVGLKFEAGVIDALLRDLLGEPAALPLLQFTLLRLWEERERNRVTMRAYRKVGGGRLALARSADALYEALLPEDQVAARRILLRLVRPGEGLEVTSNRVRRADLFRRGEDPGRVERVLRKLLDARLLRESYGETPDDTQVEVAHEALVRNWPTLVGWIEDERATLRQRRRLTAAAEQWQRLRQDPGALLRGMMLGEAETYDDLTELEQVFIAASRQAVEAEQEAREAVRQRELEQARSLAEAQARSARSLRFAVVALAVALGMALLATALAFNARAVAERGQAEADLQRATAVAAQGQAVVARDQAEAARAQAEARGYAGLALSESGRRPERALLYALAAAGDNPTSPEPAVQRAVYAVYSTSPLDQALAHAAPVRSAAWSPDGRRVATVERGGPVVIWETTTGTRLNELRPPAETQLVAWGARADLIATGQADGAVSLWDPAGDAPSAALRGHTGAVQALAWSPDGARLLSGSADGTVQLWDVDASGEPLATFTIPASAGSSRDVRTVAWSRDGRRAAIGGLDQQVYLWDLATGAQPTILSGHTGAILGVAWSPDGRQLATSSGDFTARIWDLESGQSSLVLRGHTSFVYSAAWSQDGRRLLTGSLDGTARFWDTRTGLEIRSIRGFIGGVTSATYSPDQSRVLTVSSESTTRIWATPTGLELRRLKDSATRIYGVAWRPDGAQVATVDASDGSVYLYDTGSGEQRDVFSVPGDSLSAVAWSPDGAMLLTGTAAGHLIAWNVADHSTRFDQQAHAGRIWSVAWSPEGTRLLSGGEDGLVRVADQSGATLQTLEGHGGQVFNVDWSPDGRRVASAAQDATARIWDLESGLAIVLQHGLFVYGVDWSPDGQAVATASADGTARIWDAASGAPRHTLQGHAGFVRRVAWSPDGARVATSSDDSTVRFWDTQSGQELGQIADGLGTIYAVAWSPDGRRLATGSDVSTRLWRADVAELVGELHEAVCRLYSDEQIRAVIADWKGCSVGR